MKTINENKTVFTFTRGGIHPPDNKHYSEGIAITDAPVPELFIVPLSQHLGSPAEPVVEAGDTVAYGDLLAKSSGFISANIHSPCAGEVKEFTEIFLPHGGRSKAVVIASDGSNPPDFPETDDWKSMGKEDILKAIADYGIVGMGGATFPAHVKFSLPKGYSAEYLVNKRNRVRTLSDLRPSSDAGENRGAFQGYEDPSFRAGTEGGPHRHREEQARRHRPHAGVRR